MKKQSQSKAEHRLLCSSRGAAHKKRTITAMLDAVP
jgi:hypothetical protein